MFSSIFGKRRSSPVEDESPPIPGSRQFDGFVVVDPSSPSGNIYPSIGTGSYPQRPAPPAPVAPKPLIDPTFHYLQGVPFTMSKELQMASNKDTIATEIGDILAFLSSRVNMNGDTIMRVCCWLPAGYKEVGLGASTCHTHAAWIWKTAHSTTTFMLSYGWCN